MALFLTDDIIGLTPGKFFLSYLFLFLSGSLLGYLIEVLFRRIFTAHRWVNPGFLKGPWLPLYGFGLLVMFTFCWILITYLPSGLVFYNPEGDLFGLSYRPQSLATVADLLPITIMGSSLVLLELIAGLIFVKGFKVRLWDYSNIKGNFEGIICPLFSLIWFAVAIVFYYAVDPFIYRLYVRMCAYLFGSEDGSEAAHFVAIFFLGVAYGIMLIDFIKSIGLFSKITAWASKNHVTVRYEKMRDEQKDRLALSKKKFLEDLPAPVKESIADLNKTKAKESGKVMTFLKRLVLIDPVSKGKSEGNFGKDGRPVHEEEKPAEPRK
jgi:uncharacterized membrane protein